MNAGFSCLSLLLKLGQTSRKTLMSNGGHTKVEKQSDQIESSTSQILQRSTGFAQPQKGWCFKTLNPSRSTLGVFDLKEHLGIDSLNSPFQTAIKNHQSQVFPSRVGINLPHFFFIGRTSGTIFVSPAIPRKLDSRRYTQKNAQKGTQDFEDIGISFTLIL